MGPTRLPKLLLPHLLPCFFLQRLPLLVSVVPTLACLIKLHLPLSLLLDSSSCCLRVQHSLSLLLLLLLLPWLAPTTKKDIWSLVNFSSSGCSWVVASFSLEQT